jgi:hypothetical protein
MAMLPEAVLKPQGFSGLQLLRSGLPWILSGAFCSQHGTGSEAVLLAKGFKDTCGQPLGAS